MNCFLIISWHLINFINRFFDHEPVCNQTVHSFCVSYVPQLSFNSYAPIKPDDLSLPFNKYAFDRNIPDADIIYIAIEIR